MYELGKLTIDVSSHIAAYDGTELDLTKKEFDLLVYLIENATKSFPASKPSTPYGDMILRQYQRGGRLHTVFKG